MWCCVWSGPPLAGTRCARDEMETQKPEWTLDNRPSPLTACSQQEWEAPAKKTLLTHEEGNRPLSSNYGLKLRPETGAYRGAVKQNQYRRRFIGGKQNLQMKNKVEGSNIYREIQRLQEQTHNTESRTVAGCHLCAAMHWTAHCTLGS